MNDSPWYVLHVSVNQEKKVSRHLALRSVEHYLPLYTERSRWSDRSVVLERPLFPGYVFIRIEPAFRRSIIPIPGIIRILGHGPTDTVSGEDLDKIRSGIESGHLLRPSANVEIGTRVRVRSGIFEGALGTVSELRQRCRVVIELSGVQQSFSLEVDRHDIEVLPANGYPVKPASVQRVPNFSAVRG